MRLRAHRCFLPSGGCVGKKLAATKHWKMIVVLLCICGALMLIRWAAMIWG